MKIANRIQFLVDLARIIFGILLIVHFVTCAWMNFSKGKIYQNLTYLHEFIDQEQHFKDEKLDIHQDVKNKFLN